MNHFGADETSFLYNRENLMEKSVVRNDLVHIRRGSDEVHLANLCAAIRSALAIDSSSEIAVSTTIVGIDEMSGWPST